MSAPWSAIETMITERMGATRLSGLSLAVLHAGQIIYQQGFGLANRESAKSATAHTNYNIGSITKTFTALAIMQLQERGLLSIDDPVARYLPLTLRPMGEEILLRHLLNHTSGLPALGYLEHLILHHHGRVPSPLALGSVAEILQFVNGATEWVQSRPGERHFYLNEGYELLGGIIEQVSGRPYADYIREEILLPLGMNRSFHHQTLAEADEEMAIPYLMNQKGEHFAAEYPWGHAEAAGGLISNVLDMAQFMQIFMQGSQDSQIISRASLSAMMEGTIPTPLTEPSTGAPVSYYGFGLYRSTFFGRPMIDHTGMMLVTTSAMRILPAQQLGVIVLANGTGYTLSKIADGALAMLLGEDPWAVPALRTERLLTSLTGQYQTYQGAYGVSIWRGGDYLMLRTKNQWVDVSVPLVPVDLDPVRPRFHLMADGQRVEVTFRVDAGGVEMTQERYTFRRVPPTA